MASLIVYLPVYKPAVLRSTRKAAKIQSNLHRTRSDNSKASTSSLLCSSSLQFSNVSLVVYLPVYKSQWIGSLDSVTIGQANMQWNYQALHPPEKTSSPGLGRHLEYQLTARKQPYVLDETNQSRTSRRSGVTSSGLATQAGRHQKAARASWKPAANPSTYPWVRSGTPRS